MKKIIIAGVGAQGSTIARRMDAHPGVSEIICADYDFKVAEKLSKSLKKATAVQLDARSFGPGRYVALWKREATDARSGDSVTSPPLTPVQ